MNQPEYKIGSLHILQNKHNNEKKEFEWTGKLWSSPGTGWGTKPSAMSVLGWKYVGPSGDKP